MMQAKKKPEKKFFQYMEKSNKRVNRKKGRERGGLAHRKRKSREHVNTGRLQGVKELSGGNFQDMKQGAMHREEQGVMVRQRAK